MGNPKLKTKGRKQKRTDDPGETALHGAHALVKIVAVETHTSFKTERVSSAETDKHDVGVRSHGVGNSDSLLWRNGYLNGKMRG